ncbi:11555_t:CDS:2 [Ambispora gerdemannii]|uniref:11555_t:CDS:1 n=1 Tax=Ambispora gerdemannii TaxID=144530 RepID=A0A9N8VNP4_9GLOM|nr:11555_t:CDS:2 [Ambispora gerdemannii]
MIAWNNKYPLLMLDVTFDKIYNYELCQVHVYIEKLYADHLDIDSQIHDEDSLFDDDNNTEIDALSFISLDDDYKNNNSSSSSLFEQEFLGDDTDIYSLLRVEYYGTCSTCNRFNTNIAWCQTCDPEILLLPDSSKKTQKKSESYDEHLEYIPFEEFADVKYVGSGRFSSVFSAVYLDGVKVTVNENGVWKRKRSGPVNVALKVFDQASVEINEELLRKFEIYYKHWKSGGLLRCLGITSTTSISPENPEKNYIILVIQLANGGNLRDYLKQQPPEYNKPLNWLDRLKICKQISWELNFLHSHSYVHGNLHGGNILWDKTANKFHISDFAISQRRPLCTKESDVYDLGMLIWEIRYSSSFFSIQKRNCTIDAPSQSSKQLLRKRPATLVITNTPKCFDDLLDRCWNTKPELRPTAKEIYEVLKKWVNDLEENRDTVETVAFREADEADYINNKNKDIQGNDDNNSENGNSQGSTNESLLISSEHSGNGSIDLTNNDNVNNDDTKSTNDGTSNLSTNNDLDEIPEVSNNPKKSSSCHGEIDTRFAGDSDTLVGGGVGADYAEVVNTDTLGKLKQKAKKKKKQRERIQKKIVSTFNNVFGKSRKSSANTTTIIYSCNYCDISI